MTPTPPETPAVPAVAVDADPTPPARDLVSIAKQLRAVRNAEREFLRRWLETRGRDRDAAGVGESSALSCDPHHHDWSSLYRGSVLDD
jgi:hypothetical protein